MKLRLTLQGKWDKLQNNNHVTCQMSNLRHNGRRDFSKGHGNEPPHWD
jgi:hypothetical protein